MCQALVINCGKLSNGADLQKLCLLGISFVISFKFKLNTEEYVSDVKLDSKPHVICKNFLYCSIEPPPSPILS